jgi:hypothetical protein
LSADRILKSQKYLQPERLDLFSPLGAAVFFLSLRVGKLFFFFENITGSHSLEPGWIIFLWDQAVSILYMFFFFSERIRFHSLESVNVRLFLPPSPLSPPFPPFPDGSKSGTGTRISSGGVQNTA